MLCGPLSTVMFAPAVIVLKATVPSEDAAIGTCPSVPATALMSADPFPTMSSFAASAPVCVTVPVPAGRSAMTSPRNVGAADPPDVGPAYTSFAGSLAFVTASVPVVVMGDPLTLNSAGIVRPTEDTEPPLDAPDRIFWNQSHQTFVMRRFSWTNGSRIWSGVHGGISGFAISSAPCRA
jgi:hypothetical protein